MTPKKTRNRKSQWPSAVAWTLAATLTAIVASGAPLAAQTANKLGTIDVQQILLESTVGQAVLEELQKYRQDKLDALTAKDASLKELQAKIAEGRLTLAEDKLADMKKDYEDGVIALRREQDDATREFQKRQGEKFEEVEKAVLPIIQSVGEEQGFTMIFNRYQSGLVFSDDAIDITQQVIERYDAQSSSGGSGG